MTRGKFSTGVLNRCHGVARAVGSHRNCLDQPEQLVGDVHLVVRLPHHEADHARDTGCDQEPVGERDVIGHQQRRPTQRNVFGAYQSDVENGAENEPEKSRNEVVDP